VPAVYAPREQPAKATRARLAGFGMPASVPARFPTFAPHSRSTSASTRLRTRDARVLTRSIANFARLRS